MAVIAEDLIAPNGPVEHDLFPGEVSGDDRSTLLLRLSTYITKAEVKVAAAGFPVAQEDEATEAYALWLAFKAAHTLMLARPAEEDAQMALLGRSRYDKDQRDAVLDLANEYYATYRALEAGLSTNASLSTGIPSFQSKNEYDW